MKNKILLTEFEASEITGFKVTTLRKRRWQGLPPQFLKVGSKVYYTEQDLQEYLDSCVRTKTKGDKVDKDDNEHA